MKRKEILETAIKTVCEDRNEMYGGPEQSLNEIAKLWSVYLDKKVTASDVSVMMVLFKAARVKTSDKYNPDNFIDMAGYAACASEVYKEEKEEVKDWEEQIDCSESRTVFPKE